MHSNGLCTSVHAIVPLVFKICKVYETCFLYHLWRIKGQLFWSVPSYKNQHEVQCSVIWALLHSHVLHILRTRSFNTNGIFRFRHLSTIARWSAGSTICILPAPCNKQLHNQHHEVYILWVKHCIQSTSHIIVVADHGMIHIENSSFYCICS